jgi:hypothetical protein
MIDSYSPAHTTYTMEHLARIAEQADEWSYLKSGDVYMCILKAGLQVAFTREGLRSMDTRLESTLDTLCTMRTSPQNIAEALQHSVRRWTNPNCHRRWNGEDFHIIQFESLTPSKLDGYVDIHFKHHQNVIAQDKTAISLGFDKSSTQRVALAYLEETDASIAHLYRTGMAMNLSSQEIAVFCNALLEPDTDQLIELPADMVLEAEAVYA